MKKDNLELEAEKIFFSKDSLSVEESIDFLDKEMKEYGEKYGKESLNEVKEWEHTETNFE